MPLLLPHTHTPDKIGVQTLCSSKRDVELNLLCPALSRTSTYLFFIYVQSWWLRNGDSSAHSLTLDTLLEHSGLNQFSILIRIQISCFRFSVQFRIFVCIQSSICVSIFVSIQFSIFVSIQFSICVNDQFDIQFSVFEAFNSAFVTAFNSASVFAFVSAFNFVQFSLYLIKK